MKKSVFILLLSAMGVCVIIMVGVIISAYQKMNDLSGTSAAALPTGEESAAALTDSDTEAAASVSGTDVPETQPQPTWSLQVLETDDWAGNTPRIFIGDSRMVYLSRFVTVGDNDVFISKGAMSFDWFRDTAVPQLEQVLTVSPSYKVIINMGVNDCANNVSGWKAYFAEDYAELINDLIVRYPSTKFYYASVGPLSGDYHASSSRVLKKDSMNAMVDYFNQSIQGLCFAYYIDLGEYLKTDGFTTMDGTHYDQATCQKIYDYMVSNTE